MSERPTIDDLTPAQQRRWSDVLGRLATAISPGPRSVVVDGAGPVPALADGLVGELVRRGQAAVRGDTPAPSRGEIAVAHGRASNPDSVLIWLRTRRGEEPESAGRQAQIVVDVHDPAWPVIRHVDESLADRSAWYLAETRAFFAVRAPTWDDKFGDDKPAYASAVADIGIPVGGTAIDLGCGTGRALPALREAVGPAGTVLGLDATEEMLTVARSLGRADLAQLVLADARYLPLPTGTVHAVFAAGLLGHLADIDPVLAEMARVTLVGGRLALFHPTGREALAARHGRTLRPDEPLSEGPLRAALDRAGWRLGRYDDAAHRFFACAERVAA
jgi:SAM-dependent methyltransferase